MKSITFYQSIICPRCALARRHLRKLKQEFPDVQINTVEVMGGSDAMAKDGVTQYPALVHEGNKIAGFLLTRAAIRSFLTDI